MKVRSEWRLVFKKGLGRVKTGFKIFLNLLIGRFSLNGSHYFVTFGEVYEKYQTLHLPTVTEGTRVKLLGRCERFFGPLLDMPLIFLTPEKIAEHLKNAKANYVQDPHSKRFNFLKELKDLKTILNFWTDQYDFRFRSPVRGFHTALAVIEEIPERDRLISMDETVRFLDALKDKPLYHQLATVQFFAGGRIGEIAGIQVKNIDLQNRILKIKEVITWVKGEPKVKSFPKNGKARDVYINDTLFDIFSKRLKQIPKGCPFIFFDKNSPNFGLKYNRIGVAYNQAWETAGLSGKFSGTHLMRFSSAQCARGLSGSLDAAAAVTGHASLSQASHYGRLNTNTLNKSSVIEMEKTMKQISKKPAPRKELEQAV